MSATNDINDVIASAVNARIETQVLAALSDSDVFKEFIIAALQQPVETRDPWGSRQKKTTYLQDVLQKVISERTKQAVVEAVDEHADAIKDEVAKALRKSTGAIAASLVDGFLKSASGQYPRIEVNFKGAGDD